MGQRLDPFGRRPGGSCTPPGVSAGEGWVRIPQDDDLRELAMMDPA